MSAVDLTQLLDDDDSGDDDEGDEQRTCAKCGAPCSGIICSDCAAKENEADDAEESSYLKYKNIWKTGE